MTHQERDILLAAQQQAIDLLLASAERAERIETEADASMVASLLEQHRRAEELLRQQQKDATERGFSTEEADALLTSHQEAAELLAASEQRAADAQRETKGYEAVNILMTGQREAAALLLAAWMQVTEGRPPAG